MSLDAATRVSHALLRSLNTPLMNGIIQSPGEYEYLDIDTLRDRYDSMSGGERSVVDFALSLNGQGTVNLHRCLANTDSHTRDRMLTAVTDLVAAWRNK